jgi:hypothetical protein
MQPETGGRFTVRLLEQDERRARFQVELATPAATWSGDADVLVGDGAIHFGAWSGNGEPPEWLRRYTHAALRTAWRQHAEQDTWPRRLTRWRDEPGPSREGSSEP